jgi:hypothetical protein
MPLGGGFRPAADSAVRRVQRRSPVGRGSETIGTVAPCPGRPSPRVRMQHPLRLAALARDHGNGIGRRWADDGIHEVVEEREAVRVAPEKRRRVAVHVAITSSPNCLRSSVGAFEGLPLSSVTPSSVSAYSEFCATPFESSAILRAMPCASDSPRRCRPDRAARSGGDWHHRRQRALLDARIHERARRDAWRRPLARRRRPLCWANWRGAAWRFWRGMGAATASCPRS